MEKKEGKDRYVFTIPSLPPSMNSIYNIIFKLGRIYLKPEVKKWKDDAKFFMPPLQMDGWERASIHLILSSSWYFKNGNRRKIDLQNLEKCIIDAVSEKAGVCDSIFFTKYSRKKCGEKDKIEVKIRRLRDDSKER